MLANDTWQCPLLPKKWPMIPEKWTFLPQMDHATFRMAYAPCSGLCYINGPCYVAFATWPLLLIIMFLVHKVLIGDASAL